MLMTAMRRESQDEIYLDLLTAQDLAMLKARKQNPQNTPTLSDHSLVDPKQKRYLILTLNGEFEKVHYPMPLAFLEEPDVGALRRTFTRMQSQCGMLNNSKAFSELLPDNRSYIDAFSQIDDENQTMRREIELLERSFAQTDNEFY